MANPIDIDEMKKLILEELADLQKKRKKAIEEYKKFTRGEIDPPGSTECYKLAIEIDQTVKIGIKLGILPKETIADTYYQ